MVVDPFDASVVWAGTGRAGLYKSTDCGSTWEKTNKGTNGAQLDAGGVGSLAVDHVNKGVIYATSFQGANGLWKSVNGGVDWEQTMPPGGPVSKAVPGQVVNSIAMDFDNPYHLVASFHEACVLPFEPVCEAETIDGGITWTVTSVKGGGWTSWVPYAGAFILGQTKWLFGTYETGLWLTTDSGHSWTDVTPTGGNGSLAGKTISLPFLRNPSDQRYYLPWAGGVMRSTDSTGERWELIPDSGGRSVGFVMGDQYMYSADQWSSTYHVAALNEPATWSPLAPPADLPSDQGAPYLAYDPVHHVLYSSNFAGGLWRLKTQ